MNNDLVLRQTSLATADDYDDLGAGIRSSFPVLSYRGKNWWLWYQRQELALVDEQGAPVTEIGVSLLRIPPNLSKRYFSRPFRQGERGRPDCWSDDGKKPHPTAVIPDQPDGRAKPTICAQCFMDTIGSATSADKTKRMKACGDYKRAAVKLFHPMFGRQLLGNQWSDQLIDLAETSELPMLLPIPTASLQNLKEYGKFLEANKAHAIARVTWIGFVVNEAFPKLTFRHGAEFDDNTFLGLRELRNSDDTANILAREAATEDTASEPVEDVQHATTLDAPQAQTPIAAPTKPVTVNPPLVATAVAVPPPIPQPVKPVQVPPMTQAPPPPTPIRPAFVPGGRPIKPVAAINTAISKPATPPPSTRQVMQPAQEQLPLDTEGREYNEADIPSEVDAMFQSLKLEGKTTG